MKSPKSFNPLDRLSLGRSVADALLESDVMPLGEVGTFKGAGIYAIYYVGANALYGPIAARNRHGKYAAPIYIGKAIPAGGRKGGEVSADPGTVLSRRLNEHAESVGQVSSLKLDDFYCRALIVDDIWIPLGESLLIARYAPVWNKVIDGFGNHDPGKGRYAGRRPRWDVIHPGRPWAIRCQDREESAEQIESEVRWYLESVAIPPKYFDPKELG